VAAEVDVPPILTPRLELVSMTPVFLETAFAGRSAEASGFLGAAVPAGWPTEHEQRWLRRRAEQMRGDPGLRQWLGRALVLRQPERVMVGHAGFHGEPGVSGTGKPGALEIGYTVFSPYRGQGFATEAATALLDWARRERGIRHFIASVSPDNEPSLAVTRRLGFVQTGEQWDEVDGLELVFELSVEPGARARRRPVGGA
jgi:RimJ/RimL family protein N-acetyltransferase